MAQGRRTLLSVIYIDVDQSKSFNDKFDHAIGGEVLKNFGKCMVNIGRATDVRLYPDFLISIGTSETGIHEYLTGEQLLQSPDSKMYVAKAKGAAHRAEGA